MGSMSASDAAPLPRLGEVFFDVRGSSRSMRLSWYSDTGVAVFSIWQGGTCTGTFRLPIDDLPRMMEALERGPRGAGLPADAPTLTGLPGGRPGLPAEASVAPFAEYATGQHIAPVTGELYSPPAPPSFSPSYREDPLTSPSFRDEARSGGYRQQGTAASNPASPVPPSPSYREDPLTSPSFRDEARSAGYRDSQHPYGDDAGYSPGGSGSYRAPPYQDSDRPDRGYPDQGYPADDEHYAYSGYRDDAPGGYPDRRYPDDPFQSNYPDESHGGSHPYGQPGPEPRSHRGRRSRT